MVNVSKRTVPFGSPFGTVLMPLDETNREECIQLKVNEAQAAYIATNESSLEAAKENAEVARPFVIYADGKAVGFAMFAFEPDYEDPNDRYWLWRFMIDEIGRASCRERVYDSV